MTRSAISLYAKPAHRRVARAVGYALTLGEAHGWCKLTAILCMRLKPEEIAALAFAALMALDEDTARMVAEVAG